jgi:signal transduction histidine kinase
MQPENIIQITLLILINIMGVFLSFLVLKNSYQNNLNRSFVAMIILGLIWTNSSFGALTVDDALLSEIFYRINYSATALFLFAFYHFFIVNFLKRPVGVVHWLVYSLALILALLSASTDLIISGVAINDHGKEIVFGSLADLYNVFSVVVSGYVFLSIIYHYSKAEQSEKAKLRLFFIGILFMIVMNIVFNVIYPYYFQTIRFSWLGDYSLSVFLGLTAYATLKQNILDIKSASIRSVTYISVLITITLIYILVAYSISLIFGYGEVSWQQALTGVATGLVMALAFQPLKHFFDRITDKVFYKDRYDIGDFYGNISEISNNSADLRELLERVSYEIAVTLKSEQVYFYVDVSERRSLMAGTVGFRKLSKDDAKSILEYCSNRDRIVIGSVLDPESVMYRTMVSYRLSLIVPLIKSQEILGYLCLGAHQSGSYSKRDVEALDGVADELIVAVRHALAVQEVRELNATLQQRIDNATKELRASNEVLRELDRVKDEFVSIASHQLRTPLTSIEGYISMILEGDAGEINESQRMFLENAFSSSERMVRLINDFLSVNRIQTGKFIIDRHTVDLSKIVQQEIDSLRANAEMRHIQFEYKKPDNIPDIDVDEDKIRQVIMNFSDNAIYYSRENTTVDVELTVDERNVYFVVKDRGIGVPASERENLFGKFFRASNAKKQRPDGTGVGLYLAKMVVESHGGKIIFDSVEGEGSTFGFSLPIRTLALTVLPTENNAQELKQ